MAKWTEQEIEDLKRLYRSGKTYKEIARELGRATTSINGKIAAVGLLSERKIVASSLESEKWEKLVDGYDISDLGRVRNNRTKRLLKISPDGNGYHTIKLRVNGKDKNYRIHREVALRFIPNPLNLPEVNHKKGNLADNRAIELEWVTHSENMIHAVETGLLPVLSGHTQVRITEELVHSVCKLLEKGHSCTQIVNELNDYRVSLPKVKKIKSRENWTTVSKEYNF